LVGAIRHKVNRRCQGYHCRWRGESAQLKRCVVKAR